MGSNTAAGGVVGLPWEAALVLPAPVRGLTALVLVRERFCMSRLAASADAALDAVLASASRLVSSLSTSCMHSREVCCAARQRL